MSIFEKIAERKIEEAMAKGEFDNLPSKGKPIPPDDMDMVPEELRMAYKILKNAGIVPEEIELQKSIVTLIDLMNSCADEEERKNIRIKINEKQLRYNMIMEARGLKKLDPFYNDKIMEKLNK
ncbi:MAG TPA: DUF1992 domain-containing protein [Spirochaetota bacterium]|nr:DUF1992 domain-containing protein [Spirochaetota bacterium]HPS87139.1 DUF1992 domain-containing protein [Spirochaetota bacterium]